MNKTFLIGNLTRDPELRESAKGNAIAKFAVACDRPYKDADGNKITDFFDVTAFGPLAETCAKYLSKGKKVAVVGSIEKNYYTDKNGEQRLAVDMIASEVEFLSPKDRTDEPVSDGKDTPAKRTNAGGMRGRR